MNPFTSLEASDQFVTHGRSLVDWIAHYLRDVEEFPVRARVAPGDIAASLPACAPDDAEPLDLILREAREKILPGITHWQHPGFLAYFANTATEPGILAELMGAGLNANGMIWATSPAVTELEQVMMRWLGDLLGIGDDWFGQITDTASTSTLLALAAARESHVALDIREQGLAGRQLPRVRMYCSEYAHSVVDKAVMTLGIGHQNLVKIPVDAEFRMRPDALAAAIAADRAAGFYPMAVSAVAGSTGVASVDPISAIADVCERERLWLHIDAAYAGSAAIAPEFRWVLDGAHRAQSLCVNPHKWLVTPMGCSALWVRDASALRRAFTIVPEFLKTAAGDDLDYHDVGFQLGRPFRALKLWIVLRAHGARAIADMIRTHCALAQQFARWVRETPNWEVSAPVHFSLVCFRYAPKGMSEDAMNALNMQMLETVNQRGRVFLSHTKLHGRVVLRLAIGNARTELRHIETAWAELREAGIRG